jgi:hypothetical protein
MTEPAYDEDSVPLEPLKVFMFSDNVAAIDGDMLMGTDGPNGLRAIAARLLAMGHDPDRELHVRRPGGEQRILLRDAAANQENEF